MIRRKIIHICNDYSKQALYKSLFLALSQKQIDQEIYVPVRSKNEVGKYLDSELTVHQSLVLKPADRILFRKKIRKLHADFLNKILDFKSCDLIHAHFLYSDGAVALSLKKAFNKKYIVAVRNTDLNYFFKLRPDLFFLMIEIIKEAEKVVFLNHGYKNRFQKFLNHTNVLPEEKCLVIPNGINDDWLLPVNLTYKYSEKIKLLYVGDFTKNKNVTLLLKAFNKMQKKNPNVTLTLAGGGGNHHKKVVNQINKLPETCKYIGRVDLLQLKNLYRNSDILVVPSKYETFGMVYIEALSQGCKVVFNEGEAITGLINDDSIAIGLKKISSDEIIKAIISLHSNINNTKSKCFKAAQEFSLTKLSTKYVELYNGILK